jgi:hypothetical protein
MNTRVDYGQLAAKLDYEALNKKLEQLSQREAPKKRKTVVDALEPLRERLLALHRKGWSSGQLVEELKAAGIPVSSARMRECLGRWTGGGTGSAKSRARRKGRAVAPQPGNGALAAAASPASRTRGVAGDGQCGLKFGAAASASTPKP